MTANTVPPTDHRNSFRPKKDRPFQVLFSNESFAQLSELASRDGLSNGAFLRKLVRGAWSHDVEHRPTCASGANCLVPQLHIQPAASPVPKSYAL